MRTPGCNNFIASRIFYFEIKYKYTKMTANIILGMFGVQELILVLVIVLLLFGGSKIPELMRGLGKGINEFKKAKDEVNDGLDDKPKPENEKEIG